MENHLANNDAFHERKISVSNDNSQGPLVGSRRNSTGKVVFPEIPSSSPSADKYTSVSLSDKASIYSYTVVHTSPTKEPFILIYADFPEGARVIGNLHLREGESPRIGMPVRAVIDGDAETLKYHFEA